MDAPPKPSEQPEPPTAAATTTTTTTTASPEPARDDDDPASMLQAAFPALDRAIISEVLAGHGGNADAASMALLEMSDNSGQRNSSDHSVARNAQLVSDEAYARELMAQMEREHQEAYGRPLGTPPQDDRNAANSANNINNEIDYSALNYVPRQRSRPGQTTGPTTTMHLPGYSGNSQDSRGQGRDELDQLTEQFNKFADTGKKTLTSLMSKAKDKYAQVQQQQQQQQQQRGSMQGGSQGDARGTASGPITFGKFTLPSIPAPWQNNSNNTANPPTRSMSPRDIVRTESPGMRESAMPDYSRSPPSRSGGISTDANTTPTQPMRMTSAGAAKAEEGATARSPNSGMATATSATAAYSSSPSGLSRVGSHTMGSSPAKVQMLPRQTINLLDTPKDTSTPTTIPGTAGEGVSGQQQQQQVPATSLLQHQPQQQRRKNGQDSDDDSDVEYVRNPFAEDD